MENLCSQTEKLEKCKAYVEQLKSLLFDQSTKNDFPDRERQLVELLKQSQEGLDELRRKLEQTESKLHATTDDNKVSKHVRQDFSPGQAYREGGKTRKRDPQGF